MKALTFYFWYILYSYISGLLMIHKSNRIKIGHVKICAMDSFTDDCWLLSESYFLSCLLIYCELESVEWLCIIFLQSVDYRRDWMWFYVGSFSNIKMSFITCFFACYFIWLYMHSVYINGDKILYISFNLN